MKETIKLVVDVEINFDNEQERKEVIKRAKQIITSTSILSRNSITPKKVKLI